MASEMRNNAMVDDDMTEEGVEIERVPSPADDDCSNSPEKFPVAPLPEEIPLPLPPPMPPALRSLIASNSGGLKRVSSAETNNSGSGGGGGYVNSDGSDGLYGLESGMYGDEDDLVFDLETDSEEDYLTPDEEEFDPNEEYDGAILLEEDDDDEDGGLTAISKPIEDDEKVLSAADGEQTDSKLEETLAKQKPPIDASDDEEKIPSEGEDSVAGEDSIADSMEGDDSIAQVDVVDGADRDSDGCDGAILVEDDVDDEDDVYADDERVTVMEVEAPKPVVVEENDALPMETETNEKGTGTDTHGTAPKASIITVTEEMEQRANAELRTNYLRFLQQLTNKNVNIHMVGNTNISGKFAAMQMDKQPAHCLIDELQTPTGVIDHAALRFDDILSISVPASEIPPFLDHN